MKSNKGAGWERTCSVALSIWISKCYGAPRTDLFWRSPGSGSRASRSLSRGVSLVPHSGDLVATDAMAAPFLRLFYIECKSYKGFDLDRVAFGKKGRFWEAWDRTERDARTYKRAPFVLLKVVRFGEAIATDVRGARIITAGLPRHVALPPSITFPRFNAVFFLLPEFYARVNADKLVQAEELIRNPE